MSGEEFATREEAFEAAEDVPTHDRLDNSMGCVIARRLNRREFLGGSLAVPAVTAMFGAQALTTSSGPASASGALPFRELASGVDEDHHAAEGYEAQVLLRWGDPLGPVLASLTRRSSPVRIRRGALAITTTTSPSSLSIRPRHAACCASTTSIRARR